MLLEILDIDRHIVRRVQRRARPPNLEDIILGRGRERPILIRAPRQVRRATRVSSMNEQELGRSVLLVLGRLFESDLGDVPEVDAAVARGRGEDGFVRGGPGELEDFVVVRLEGVELDFEVAEVPEGDRLGARSVGATERRGERDGPCLLNR